MSTNSGASQKMPRRHVEQCERSPRARCTCTYLYTLFVKPGTSTSRAWRALTFLNAPLVTSVDRLHLWMGLVILLLVIRHKGLGVTFYV